MIELPDVVVARARSEGADEWLADLPDVVEALAVEWGFTLGSAYAEGTEAFVAEATCDDGTPAVFKALVPRAVDGFDTREAMMLRLTAGDGCPALYREDAARGTLLMERLGPSMFALGAPYAERLPALCDVARRIWRPVDATAFPNGADKAVALAEFVATTWEELDRPCSEAAVDHALRCAESRRAAHDDERSVLVHGDVHQWNALRTLDGHGWKLVDPDGYVAEPELDLGVVIREDPLELRELADPLEVARRMARECDLDATAIWEWGVVERVSTGLSATRIGLQPVGRQLLETADWLAATRGSPSGP